MLTRRSFLLKAGVLSLTPWLSGCQGSQAALKVMLLEGSIPPQFPKQFRSSLAKSITLSLKPEAQLQELYRFLKKWQNKDSIENNPGDLLSLIPKRTPAIANLVTLGDYWLAEAIEKQLIQPLDLENLPGWANLLTPWQDLVRRNQQGKLDKQGKIWAAPYRWGSTIIVYRRDKFKSLGWQPTDWSDLWREELSNRISILDEYREVIGLTLKKLGHSYNTLDLSKVPSLKSELQALNKQVKFYSSQNYLQPLILGDTWLAVGWSTDILPLRSRYPNLEVIIPESGTAMWSDLWVQPKSLPSDNSAPKISEDNQIINQWIDFCWRPKYAQQISLLTNAASPIILTLDQENLDPKIKEDQIINVNPAIFEKSDFLFPLPPQINQEYQSLWEEVRS